MVGHGVEDEIRGCGLAAGVAGQRRGIGGAAVRIGRELRPDLLPVVRAQGFARSGPLCSLFNCEATFDRDAAKPPVPKARRADFDFLCKSGEAAAVLDCLIEWVHAFDSTHFVYGGQTFCVTHSVNCSLFFLYDQKDKHTLAPCCRNPRNVFER